MRFAQFAHFLTFPYEHACVGLTVRGNNDLLVDCRYWAIGVSSACLTRVCGGECFHIAHTNISSSIEVDELVQLGVGIKSCLGFYQSSRLGALSWWWLLFKATMGVKKFLLSAKEFSSVQERCSLGLTGRIYKRDFKRVSVRQI